MEYTLSAKFVGRECAYMCVRKGKKEEGWEGEGRRRDNPY
jgi:hypothetical protein